MIDVAPATTPKEKFGDIKDAADDAAKDLSAAKAIASADKKTAYETALTTIAGRKADYDLAKALVESYAKWNALKTDGSASAVAAALNEMLAAYEAIGATKDTAFNAYGDADTTPHNFGITGMTYKTASDAAKAEIAKVPVDASVELELADTNKANVIKMTVTDDGSGNDLYTLTVKSKAAVTKIKEWLQVKAGSVYDTTDATNAFHASAADKDLSGGSVESIVFKGTGTPDAGKSQTIKVQVVEVVAADKVKADADELKELLAAGITIEPTDAKESTVTADVKAAVGKLVKDGTAKLTYQSEIKASSDSVEWVHEDGVDWTVPSVEAGSSWRETFKVTLTLTDNGSPETTEDIEMNVTVKIVKP